LPWIIFCFSSGLVSSAKFLSSGLLVYRYVVKVQVFAEDSYNEKSIYVLI
jgi:hypothetical protein